jgi:hypothetical protein
VKQLLRKDMDKQRILCVNVALLFGEKNTVESKAWLDKHYWNSAPEKFKRGKMSIQDNAHLGARKRLLSTKTSKKFTK